MASIEAVFSSLTGSLAGEKLDAAAFAALSDDDLEATHTSIAALLVESTKCAALSAAEIARRSDRALGSSGLAWRKGHVSPEAMVQSLSGGFGFGHHGADVDEAAGLAAGAAEHAAEHPDDTPEWELPEVAFEPPWHAPLGDAVSAGRISLDTANSLRKGLGEPADGVPAEALHDALTALIENCAGTAQDGAARDGAARDGAGRLIVASQGLNAEQAFTAARRARDWIDEAGIAARSNAMRAAQYLRTWRKPSGMVHGEFDLNPENGTFFLEVLDRITGPRRGGPRFVDKERKARAQKLIDDPRSTDLIHAESLIELIHIAITADPNKVYLSLIHISEPT